MVLIINFHDFIGERRTRTSTSATQTTDFSSAALPICIPRLHHFRRQSDLSSFEYIFKSNQMFPTHWTFWKFFMEQLIPLFFLKQVSSYGLDISYWNSSVGYQGIEPRYLRVYFIRILTPICSIPLCYSTQLAVIQTTQLLQHSPY